uniref:Uncharacterized protein n=1 Tax=Trichogramma kaykai TaxID=54128 RepID=A0ABD2WLT2_9HYME
MCTKQKSDLQVEYTYTFCGALSSLYQPDSIEIMYLEVSPVNANIIGVSALLILVSLLCALCCGAIARRAFFRFSCAGSGSTNSSSRASRSSTV